MKINPSKPLSPLDPSHTALLGQPTTWEIPRADGLNYQISGWKIGEGRKGVGSDDPSTWRMGTTVEIWLTTKGRLITAVIQSKRHNPATAEVDDINTESLRSQFHETPAAAYEWLVADGKGKLGSASKFAWVQACRTFPAMNGLEFEYVD